MKSNPMVTISLPCYNHEKYIRQSIESVLTQTYQDFELLIIENGSTDHSRDIIKEYEDQATVIYFDENDLERVVKVCLQETRGKYHAIMSSDDIWMPDKLEKQIAFLEEHPEYQACSTWAEYGDENMNTLNDFTYMLFKQNNRTSAEWLKAFCDNGNCLCAPSMIMRLATYLDAFRTNIAYWQLFDLAAWVRFLLKGDRLYVYPEVLVKMRKHNKAISYSDYSTRNVLEEQSSLQVEIIEKISDEMFCESFGEEFLRPGCRSHEEIVCEKILYLFRQAEKQLALQTRAFDFYYKHFSDDKVAETLKEKYNMNHQFFVDLSKEIGTVNIVEHGYAVGKKEAGKEM